MDHNTVNVIYEPETIPIVITDGNNRLDLLVGGGLFVDDIFVTAGTYNTTTFLSALNAAIAIKNNGAGLANYSITVTYSTKQINLICSIQTGRWIWRRNKNKRLFYEKLFRFNTFPFPSDPAETFNLKLL